MCACTHAPSSRSSAGALAVLAPRGDPGRDRLRDPPSPGCLRRRFVTFGLAWFCGAVAGLWQGRPMRLLRSGLALSAVLVAVLRARRLRRPPRRHPRSRHRQSRHVLRRLLHPRPGRRMSFPRWGRIPLLQLGRPARWHRRLAHRDERSRLLASGPLRRRPGRQSRRSRRQPPRLRPPRRLPLSEAVT